MVSKSKIKIFVASLAILGCSKAPEVCVVDADAASAEIDASGSVDAPEDTSSTVDLSKDVSPSQEN